MQMAVLERFKSSTDYGEACCRRAQAKAAVVNCGQRGVLAEKTTLLASRMATSNKEEVM
jgi:hypothetical protein